MLTFSTKIKGEKKSMISDTEHRMSQYEPAKCKKTLTGFPVLLIFSVESMHSLQELPLLAAARVIDKVPGKNLFQLADREVFYRLFIVQIRQRGSNSPLCRRADLQSIGETELSVISFTSTGKIIQFCGRAKKTRFTPLWYFQQVPGSRGTLLEYPHAPVWVKIHSLFKVCLNSH